MSRNLPILPQLFFAGTMSSPQYLKPSEFGGFGRGEGDLPQLNNDEFVSLCPPDIQPNTRIIAVCGVSDATGRGAPSKDGWFFSDFFLFHHLLEDSRESRSSLYFNIKTDCFSSSHVLFSKPNMADLCQSKAACYKLQRVCSW